MRFAFTCLPAAFRFPACPVRPFISSRNKRSPRPYAETIVFQIYVRLLLQKFKGKKSKTQNPEPVAPYTSALRTLRHWYRPGEPSYLLRWVRNVKNRTVSARLYAVKRYFRSLLSITLAKTFTIVLNTVRPIVRERVYISTGSARHQHAGGLGRKYSLDLTDSTS